MDVVNHICQPTSTEIERLIAHCDAQISEYRTAAYRGPINIDQSIAMLNLMRRRREFRKLSVRGEITLTAEEFSAMTAAV